MKIKEELIAYFKALGYDQCLLYLLACKHGLQCTISEEEFKFLADNKYIQRNILENKIICLLGLYEGEDDVKVDVDLGVIHDITSRIDEYRKKFKFPSVRQGMMGDKNTCIENMIRFCTENKVTFDDVLLVTDVFIQYTETRYLPNADNFIYSLQNGKEISKLKIAFEEREGEGVTRTYYAENIL